ncbi:protein kinase [Frankia sp. AgPm24]|uniref:serine/threonine-protein kinase n=1 Tax=Frankia sp. AgPm24 TaxID=631128 RepID=UPI00200C4269|nr:serine/threonine-protein kinase [Frankia sp. AgPm24]MCK9924408.1 protein kinase [Frankia sp. AgPm24]
MLVERAQVEAALPGYELGVVLGQGASGVVLEARHRQISRRVAVKVLTRAGVQARAGFRREADVLAGLDHPHIVRIYDYVERDDLALLIMEHLGGGTLRTRLPTTSQAAACAVGLAAADALAAAHAAGVLHRDVKPANILFTRDGAPKLVDFGISRFFGGSSTSVHSIAGTPGYMAPEQIGGGRVGAGTDLYALGVVLFRLLSGGMPIDPGLPPAQIWRRQVDEPAPAPRGVADPLAAVIRQALQRDRNDRQGSAAEFARQLATAATAVFGSGWLAASGVIVRAERALLDATHDATAHHRPPLADLTTHTPTSPAAPAEPRTPPPGPTAPGPPAPGPPAEQTTQTAQTARPDTSDLTDPARHHDVASDGGDASDLVIETGASRRTGREDGSAGDGRDRERHRRQARLAIPAAVAAVAAIIIVTVLFPGGSDANGRDTGQAVGTTGPSSSVGPAPSSAGSGTAPSAVPAARLGTRLLGPTGPTGATDPARTAGAVVSGLAAGPDGTQVAVGGTSGGELTSAPADVTPLAWVSAEGQRWQAVTVVLPAGARSGSMAAVAYLPGHGFVAVGSIRPAVSPTPAASGGAEASRPALWRSSDGRGWTAVPSAADLSGEITGLVPHADALLAVGRPADDRGEGAVWRSVDGIAWTRVTVQGLGGPAEQRVDCAVELAGGSLLAAGTELAGSATVTRLRRSSDGARWELTAASLPSGLVLTSLARLPDNRVLGIGSTGGASDLRPALAVGDPTGGRWTVIPLATASRTELLGVLVAGATVRVAGTVADAKGGPPSAGIWQLPLR